MMGTDVASAQQFMTAFSKHDKTYASLEKTLAAVSSHGNEVFPEIASLTEERVRALAQDSRLLEQYDATSLRALMDHVNEKCIEWSVQNKSGFGTRRIANLMRLKMSVLDPTMGRAAPVMMVCTALAIVVAIVKQIDLHFFEENPEGRQRTGRFLNAVAFVSGGAALAWVAHHDSEWGQVLAVVLCLLLVKQFFTVWQKQKI
jgi:hypothetical protein